MTSFMPRSRRRALLSVVLLFCAVTVLRFSVGSAADAYSLLYVVPIALAALQWGLVGGGAAAGLAMILVIVWAHVDDVGLSIAGYLTRGVAFGVLGTLVGHETQRRRAFEAEREQLMIRVEAMARTDGLTGLLNRRAWDEELRREMERARRGGGRFAVALLDLDHFKRFNDRHGHVSGDLLLQRAAQEWRMRVRVVDTLARYGGEEFAVLLPDCPPTDAVDVIDRVRMATPMGQTLSAGITYTDGDEAVEALLRRVDEALYAAKRAGRDRCVVVPSPG